MSKVMLDIIVHGTVFGGFIILGIISILMCVQGIKKGARTRENLKASIAGLIAGIIGFIIIVLPKIISILNKK